MIFDVHVHVGALQSGYAGNFLCPRSRMNLPLRILVKRLNERVSSIDASSPDEAFQCLLQRWINESMIDGVVLLAIDGVYTLEGEPDWEATQLVAGNNFVADIAQSNPRLLFGASVHPYRRDALKELDRVAARGACLIKWLPSAQNIDPADPQCIPFYERMAHHGLPLLSHTGIEHTLAKFSNALNDPRRLKNALRQGVTVIAAHCGTRMFLYERYYFPEWAEMAKEYPNFFGDISAFALPLHGSPLKSILRDPDLTAKILYGSDFPTPAMPRWYLPRLGWSESQELSRIENPFDKPLMLMRKLGVPEEVFTRAETLLRLPATSLASAKEPAQ